jgi:hypothetical protein
MTSSQPSAIASFAIAIAATLTAKLTVIGTESQGSFEMWKLRIRWQEHTLQIFCLADTKERAAIVAAANFEGCKVLAFTQVRRAF